MKIGEIANNIIDFLKQKGCREIGHIKFISTTDCEDYLQFSVNDIGKEPAVQGILRKTFEKIKVTLNIIEFGVEEKDIDNKVDLEIRTIKNYFSNLK